jgi:parallel beta-helix repeat protein
MLLLLSGLPVRSQVYVGGVLTDNATYSAANNPYIVTQDLIISPGVSLTLEPGVQMLFETGTGLFCKGFLIARGTPSDSIRFLPNSDLSFPDQWNGISINGSKTYIGEDSTYVSGTSLSCCVLKYATSAVTLDEYSALLLESSDFSDCSYGIFMRLSAYNIFRNNRFSHCDFGIYFAGGSYNPGNHIAGNSFMKCSEVGIFINNQASESGRNYIAKNVFTSCRTGLQIGNFSNNGNGNNVITGNTFMMNKDAVKLFHRTNVLINNNLILNGIGLTLWESGNNVISYNLFSRNLDHAIAFHAGSSYNTVSYNNMNYSKGAVVIVPDSSKNSLFNTLIYNTVCFNSEESFQLRNAPQGPVQFNNIEDDGDSCSFQNFSDTLIHAEYNYWGTSNPAAIGRIIYDVFDSSEMGEVLFGPMLTEILSTAPVPPPDTVIKQRIGSHLVLSWNQESVQDLAGYAVHYGSFDNLNFEHRVPVGLNTAFDIGEHPFADTVAVTTLDALADGSNDRREGFESDFYFAREAPFAGPDTAICIDAGYVIGDATADGFIKVHWKTSGDGSFSNPDVLNPVYLPGPSDYENRSVDLYLTGASGTWKYTDAAHITFHQPPVVFAGNDTIITSDAVFSASMASALAYEHLRWSSSGDGSFTSDTIPVPLYYPGEADKASGKVKLSLTAYSLCGIATDTLLLNIAPGYSIQGKVHAGKHFSPGTEVSLYRYAPGEARPVRRVITSEDGSFNMKSLLAGKYFLYALPDPGQSPGYVPTYFFSNVHWEDAEVIDLYADTYDVDLNLISTMPLSSGGEGSISGELVPVGDGGQCGNVSVLLYDGLKQAILSWSMVSNTQGFKFRELPFGEYFLAGEKAGLPRILSAPILLSPSQPDVDSIKLQCTGVDYKFRMPDGYSAGEEDPEVVFYPNPVVDQLYISGLRISGLYAVRIFSLQGVEVYQRNFIGETPVNVLSVSTLPAGFYRIEISSNSKRLFFKKMIKIHQ